MVMGEQVTRAKQSMRLSIAKNTINDQEERNHLSQNDDETDCTGSIEDKDDGRIQNIEG